MEKRYLIYYFIFLNLFSLSIYGQRIKSKKKISSNVEKFSLVPFKEVVRKDSIRITSFVEIPFNSLQFIKKENSFIAKYQISLGIKNKKGVDLGHEIWSDTIIVNDYQSTQSFLKNRKHFFSYNALVNSKYTVFAELIDLDTRKKGIKQKKLI